MIGYVGLFILKPDGLFLFLFMDCIFSKEFMNASHFYSKKKEAKPARTERYVRAGMPPLMKKLLKINSFH